ncbi:ABC transporter [Longispora fulva]|uniref:Peptide/nickel transport system substrate-binding protein n=1 Tax=Longispora fulva TaxID=619741 RepID=A0A8J7GHA9_9ACTN|nr:ABC transporter substrate-binding protein [Longispora fulva]MBG6137951.1 peptide/nickel transport system substrate-binding protein [Longispora fulva]GIG60204.1 ABC transporter [Longispora fulva]
MRRSAVQLVVGALAVGLALTGCESTRNAGGTDDKPAQQDIIIDHAGKAPTPAPEVPGAKKGGQILWLEDGEFQHFDPQQMYYSDSLDAGTQVMFRMLTTFVEDPNGGPLRLVGDLATNTGVSSDGDKTWTYTLRDGIKFEDGSPITSKDIAYGVARSFSRYGDQGMQYIQNALDPKREYKGPYEGNLKVPGVSTPNDHTIVFTFAQPHAEFPYLAAYPTVAPVPQAKDSKDKYEDEWVASGPYKRQVQKKDQYMILERNPYWDAKTDPARHQYVDTIKFDWSVNRASQTQRLMVSRGEDQTAVMTASVAQQDIATVAGDSNLKGRTMEAATPFTNFVYINTQRVTDLDVRKALNYAFDRDSYVKALGGLKVARPATTILAQTVPGYKDYDVYQAGPTGDIAKAKKLVEGKKVGKLGYCFPNTVNGQKNAVVVQAAFQRDNVFDVAMVPVESKEYSNVVGASNTTCDLIANGWAADFPDGSSTLQVLFDGTSIRPTGNQNLSYLNVPALNDEFAKLALMGDRAQAAPLYGALDEKIMREYAPVVPTHYVRAYQLNGTKVGGAFMSPLYAQVNLTGIFVQ